MTDFADVAIARRYDPLTRDAAINLLTEIVIDAIETHRRYAEQNPKFSRRYINEAAYQRWSKAEAAKSFFASQSFISLVGHSELTPIRLASASFRNRRYPQVVEISHHPLRDSCPVTILHRVVFRQSVCTENSLIWRALCPMQPPTAASGCP
jgi:hypothetical protein